MITDLRTYGLSAFALIFSSMPQVNMYLQTAVLILTIVLVIIQIYQKTK
tara:strand:+ start:3126 stop:3272 length:147 start_codon:yes stop_codon:yes gene_type:complete